MLKRILLSIAICLSILQATPGTVYLVLGSDTAIWDGMSVNTYHCTYNPALYQDPQANAAIVMDPVFRAQFLDSFGNPMKMTWWMMAGNIFRYATNTNVPVPNIMTLHLMKQYHGSQIIANEDELSLHYHTFTWTDYDRDGFYFWNQALDFTECQDDWETTLVQFLIEENIFPVSFRSGWHYMDNDWQATLNALIPYAMHNDWPSQHEDHTEPLDNSYDWSQAPSTFIPFRPAGDNYQIPGAGPGWNVRSASFQHVIQSGLMDTVFAHANQGVDQVACFWAHLPESDFPTNMATLDDLAHTTAETYPDVQFRYCTAVEAMQLWRGTTDSLPPVITVTADTSGGTLILDIQSDETLFQDSPFVAVKRRNESYARVVCTLLSQNHWATEALPLTTVAQYALAATDTLGNLAILHEEILPADQYLEYGDPGYAETSGSWTTSSAAAWGVDSRVANVPPGAEAALAWQPQVWPGIPYHLYLQVPSVESPPFEWHLRILTGTDTLSSVLEGPLPGHEWIYLATPVFDSAGTARIEMEGVVSSDGAPATMAMDVLRCTPLVADRDLIIPDTRLDFGEITLADSAQQGLRLGNHGREPLSISGMETDLQNLLLPTGFPVVIDPQATITLPIFLVPGDLGPVSGTILISSDDEFHPTRQLPVTAVVVPPFVIVDNEDSLLYGEHGEWFTSVAQAWGSSSRYAIRGSGAWAEFTIPIPQNGIYDYYQIVPSTVNAVDAALYVLRIDDLPVDSIWADQNTGSGTWVYLGRGYLPESGRVEIRVSDPEPCNGAVLRADAVKFQVVDPASSTGPRDLAAIPEHFQIAPNFPNPFNPRTHFRWFQPRPGLTRIQVFDLGGHLVREMEQRSSSSGWQSSSWDGRGQQGHPLPAGVYICRFLSDAEARQLKVTLLR